MVALFPSNGPLGIFQSMSTVQGTFDLGFVAGSYLSAEGTTALSTPNVAGGGPSFADVIVASRMAAASGPQM